MEKINTLLIGVGYHAKRIYVPDLKNNSLVNFAACLDLKKQEESIRAFFKDKEVDVACYFTNNYEISDSLNTEEERQLDLIIKKHNIQAVIVSTEPLAHFKYTKWALDNNLNVLLDKPITTEIDVSINEDKAKKIYDDFKSLKNIYEKKLEKSNLVFMLQAQRRFHEGFITVKEKIVEMKNLTKCPITSIVSFHSDGQWRFPKEIVEQEYHSYNQGYGKMSHSGYHSLDIAIWFAENSLVESKKWDNFQLHTQFVRPSDFIDQINREDYVRMFPQIEKDLIDDEVIKKIKDVKGEIDAFTNISFKKEGSIITNITCNAVHNGFAQRNWTDVTNRDLYKGNGRIRQESYIIEQGPFQSIIINSFQSEEILKGNIPAYDIGGEYHFDIHVFRNSVLFPQYKSYEFINIKDLGYISDEGYSRGHQEKARRSCDADFFKSIINNIPVSEQKSNFLTHDLTTKVLSAIYISAAKQYNKCEGFIKEII